MYRNPLPVPTRRQEFRPKYGDTPLYEHHTTQPGLQRCADAPARAPAAARRGEPARDRAHGGGRAVRWSTSCWMRCRRRRGTPAGGGEVDLIADFAAAIPVEVIGNLLAFPREDRGPLRGWSLAILGAPSSRRRPRPCTTPAIARCVEFMDYLRTLVAGAPRATARPGRGRPHAAAAAGCRRRRPERAAAAAQLHLPAQRRARDHHQPDRQRPACAADPSRPVAAAGASRRRCWPRRSRRCCATRARCSSTTGACSSGRGSAGAAFAAGHPGHPLRRRGQPRPGAVPRSGPLRHRAASPTATWPSAMATMPAPA